MGYIWISIFILACVRHAASEFNPSVCSILEESRGLIPPPLPENFELKAERLDHNKKTISYEELYFDYVNSRARYRSIEESIEYNHLFDYVTDQVVEWIKVHPGTSIKRDPLSYNCEAVDMQQSPYIYTFGYKDWMGEHPKMFNSYEVLRYGGQYLYAANGTLNLYDRGLQVNKFVGCVYDSYVDATVFNEYYFADTKKVQPSGGTPSIIVTGSDERPLSVPVKLHVEGLYFANNSDQPINETYSISWFKGNPQFDTKTFQIPPWIYCDDYNGRKEIPKFPKAFSTRVVINTFVIDMLGQLEEKTSSESYEEIYYDSDRKLARRDFTPNEYIDTEIKSKFGSLGRVSTIYDYNEGLRYTINKLSGRCYIQPIAENEYFDSEEQLIYKKMATPEEVFLMQMDDMEYKGKAFSRDIECDVWNGKHYHEKYGASLVKEVYFSTNGWHEIADGMMQYQVPVKNVLIKQEIDGQSSEGVSTYNFLKFRGKAPRMVHFDIKNCVELIEHKRFAIELALSKESGEQVFKYRWQFLEAAQLYIANKTDVRTPLRIQRLHLRHQSMSSSRIFLVFSLLEKAPLKNPYGQKGQDIQGAILLLQKLVDAGNFSVEFKNPSTKEPIAVIAQKGSLYSLTATGSIITAVPLMTAIPMKRADDVRIIKKDNYSYEEHNGMTPGHLALLAFAMLFIGVGIGIATMYLYIRIYSERYVEDNTELRSQAGASSAGNASAP